MYMLTLCKPTGMTVHTETDHLTPSTTYVVPSVSIIRKMHGTKRTCTIEQKLCIFVLEVHVLDQQLCGL